MTTKALAEQKKRGEICYVPFGEAREVCLTVGMVRQFLCTPTSKGFDPSDQDCVKFLMLCQSKRLNPWSGDAYLVGFDTQNGPQFSLITAHQALLKRAEASEHFNGIEWGVIVERDGEEHQRQGDRVAKGEKLVGGWAKCYRKDRVVPFSNEVGLEVYSTGRSRWKVDPGGMIAKVARASVLRLAYPTELSGLYIGEETPAMGGGEAVSEALERLDERRPSEQPEPEPVMTEADQFEQENPA